MRAIMVTMGYICRFKRKMLEILSEYNLNEDKLRALFKLV